MNAETFRRAAQGACILMAALLVLFQFALTPGRAAPVGLFALFVVVWLFGALMLAVAPVFGGMGTALYGVISAIGAWQTHAAATWENLLLVGGSLLASALAVAFLVARSRSGATAKAR